MEETLENIALDDSTMEGKYLTFFAGNDPMGSESELPGISAGSQNRYIQNVGKIGHHVVLLVNCERLLYEEEPEALAEAV